MEPDLSAGSAVASGGTPQVDRLGVIGRHRSAVLTIVAWALGLAALYSFTRTPVYTADAAVLVRPAISTIGSSDGEVNPDTESEVVQSTAVAQQAALRMVEHPRIGTMLASLSVDVPENTEILGILYSSPDPVSARDGARAFAEAYLEYRRSQAEVTVSDLVSTLQGELDELNLEIEDLRTRLTDPASDAEESEIRTVSRTPRRADRRSRASFSSPRPRRSIRAR